MTFEFIVAAIVFFSLILYIMVFLNSTLSEYREEFYVNDLQSRVMKISDLLLHNKDVGISGGYPVINTALVDSLQQTCDNNYPSLLRALDITDHRIRIQINKSRSGDIILDCPSVISIPGSATKVGVTRFGVLNTTNEMVIINLLMW